MIFTVIRAKPCGHIGAMAPVDNPVLVEKVAREQRLLTLAGDDRWELADMELEPATEAFVAGLSCRRCALDLPAFAKAMRDADPDELKIARGDRT